MSDSSATTIQRTAGMIARTELTSTDPEATQEFLESVFGWKFDSVKTPSGEMKTFRTPGGAEGSVRPTQPRGSGKYQLHSC